MSEKEVKIRTDDGHIINGVLRTSSKKSSVLLIFVHGLTGHKNEHIFYNGAKFFSRHGINTFRFDLYSGKTKGRILSKCGLSTHAQDLNKVVKYFSQKFKKIFVAGHSLGGPVILLSQTDLFGGIILWDSAATLSKRLLKELNYKKCLNAYICNWGAEFILGKKMYNEWKKFPKVKETLAKIEKPIKIIVAGDGLLTKEGEQYYKYANKPKEFISIKGAGHNFNDNETEIELFKQTLGFIKKYRYGSDN